MMAFKRAAIPGVLVLVLAGCSSSSNDDDTDPADSGSPSSDPSEPSTPDSDTPEPEPSAPDPDPDSPDPDPVTPDPDPATPDPDPATPDPDPATPDPDPATPDPDPATPDPDPATPDPDPATPDPDPTSPDPDGDTPEPPAADPVSVVTPDNVVALVTETYSLGFNDFGDAYVIPRGVHGLVRIDNSSATAVEAPVNDTITCSNGGSQVVTGERSIDDVELSVVYTACDVPDLGVVSGTVDVDVSSTTGENVDSASVYDIERETRYDITVEGFVASDDIASVRLVGDFDLDDGEVDHVVSTYSEVRTDGGTVSVSTNGSYLDPEISPDGPYSFDGTFTLQSHPTIPAGSSVTVVVTDYSELFDFGEGDGNDLLRFGSFSLTGSDGSSATVADSVANSGVIADVTVQDAAGAIVLNESRPWSDF